MRQTLHGSPPPLSRDDDRGVLNVAHRGASGDHPENTLAAISGALRLDVDSIELDVQRSRDGALVLMHDTTLTRTTDAKAQFPRRGPWNVADFDYDELLRLDAGAWKGPFFAGERIPTLEQAIGLVESSSTGLLLELKAPALYPGIVTDVVSTLRGVPDFLGQALAERRLVVESFDFAAMKAHKTRAPEVPVGLLGAPARANLAALGTWADQVNPHHWSVDRSYVDEVHRQGMGCLAWTVNRASAMRRALELGVDGIITNEPARLAGALLRRSERRSHRWWTPGRPSQRFGVRHPVRTAVPG
jgi:glycerophosphoryl diester phosphodiesterase